MRILIVEDIALLATTMCMVLEDAGHEVVGPAATVAAGIALAEQHRPDLALVNINLKDGDSGIELARELLRRRNIPAIFVSGNSSDARGAQDAALGYIAKPWTDDCLLKSVEVAKAVRDGRKSIQVPPGMELFASRS